MSRFHIHRSFEEELAKKADEFSMQPSLSTWRGVEKGIVKTRSIQTYWKIGVLSLSMLAILGIVFIQEDKRSATTQPAKAGITLPIPLFDGAARDLSGGMSRRNEGATASPKTSTFDAESLPALTLVKKGERELETGPASIETADRENQKIVLKAVQPKATPFESGNVTRDMGPAHSSLDPEKRPSGGKKRDAWYVQANFSPAYAYRNISARTEYARPLENTKKQLDKGISGYSTRIQARYHFSDRFSLAFGLGYTRSGERIGMAPKKNSPAYDALAKEYGYETAEMNTLGDVSYFTNNYTYTELPVTLYSKRPISPRLSLTTGLGLSLGYMISTNARCYDYRVDHYVNNPRFLRDWTIGSHAQILLEYSVNTRWGIAAGPEFNYALLSTYRNYYTLSQHQFSVGMNFGVQWKLFDITKSRLAG